MRFSIIILMAILIMCGTRVINANVLADTIPLPPESPALISGSVSTCVGETTEYNCDIPLGCESNWYINGDLFGTAGGTLEITWTSTGDHLIEVEIQCDTILHNAGSLLVIVEGLPSNPSQIQGSDKVCTGSSIMYSTQVGIGELCEWRVDGIVQISDSTTMSYNWVELGTHTIDVRAINECGSSNPSIFNVNVFEIPIVDLGDDIEIFEGESVMLDAGNPGCDYLWSTGESTQTIMVSETGIYEVTVSNPCGNISDEVNVDVIVGQHEIDDNEIGIVIIDDYLYFKPWNKSISIIQIYDLNNRLINECENTINCYLSGSGLFIIRVTFENNMIITRKLLK
jgi:PKD domain-containing protein